LAICAQPGDDLIGIGRTAFRFGLERNEKIPGVECGLTSAHGEAGDIRIFAHDVGQLQHALAHGTE